MRVLSVSGTSNLCISTSQQPYCQFRNFREGGTGAWSSSNNSVATVNAAGLVTAKLGHVSLHIPCEVVEVLYLPQAVNVFGIPITHHPLHPHSGQSSSLCPIAYSLTYSISAVAMRPVTRGMYPLDGPYSGQGTTAIVVDAGSQSTGSKTFLATMLRPCTSLQLHCTENF
jgi:hypothetical protein